jgi:hypothetical protein
MNHSKGMVLSLNKVVDIDSSSVNIISGLEAQKTLFLYYWKENQKVKNYLAH